MTAALASLDGKLDEYLALPTRASTALQLDEGREGRGRVHTPGAGARAPDRRRQALLQPAPGGGRRRGRGRLPHRSCRRLRRSHPRHAAASARHRAPRRRRLDERRRARLDEPVRRGRLEVQRRHRRGGRRCRLRRDHVRLRPLPHRRRRLRGRVQRQAQGAQDRHDREVRRVRALRLEPLGARVSAAVFGLTATREMGIGQRPSLLAKHLDVIYPMVYPSHFGAGEYSLTIPTRSPASPSRGRCATSGATCAAATPCSSPGSRTSRWAATTPSRTSARRSLRPAMPRAPGSSCGTRAASTRRPPCANARRRADFHRDAHRPVRELWKMWKNELSAIAENGPAPGAAPGGRLDCRLRRARSASRSKPHRGGRRRKPKVGRRGGRKRNRLGEFFCPDRLRGHGR